jgi:hypothetical protein
MPAAIDAPCEYVIGHIEHFPLPLEVTSTLISAKDKIHYLTIQATNNNLAELINF